MTFRALLAAVAAQLNEVCVEIFSQCVGPVSSGSSRQFFSAFCDD
jgi:hypothetical protein